MNHWRQLAIDDLGVCSCQSLGKSALRLCVRLTNSCFVNSGTLGCAAAETSKASHKDHAKRSEQGRSQAPKPADLKRPEPKRRVGTSVVARRVGIDGTYRHSQGSFFLAHKATVGVAGAPPGWWWPIGLCSLLAAVCFGAMSWQGTFGLKCFELPTRLCEPVHTHVGWWVLVS
jgi:hypothetical protein